MGLHPASANQYSFVQSWGRDINAAYDDKNEPALCG